VWEWFVSVRVKNQRSESDMRSVISQAKVFIESQAATRINCFISGKIIKVQ
jgi:hypothetical protein